MGINFVRGKLRSEGRLIYAMFDFNTSIMLPPTARKEDFRLPYYESWVGTYYFPCDTQQGEFDYNPFVYDVAVLGLELSVMYHPRHALPVHSRSVSIVLSCSRYFPSPYYYVPYVTTSNNKIYC